MRNHYIIALLGMSALGAGCIVAEPEPEPPREFERFEMNWGYGPCAPGVDCSGSLELDASGTLRLDTPCMTQLGIQCDYEDSGTYVFTVSGADLDAAIAVLTDPDLIRLLDRPETVCEPVLDVGEQMRLRMNGVEHVNQTVFCEDAPVVAARAALSELVEKYLAVPMPGDGLALVGAGWSFGFCAGACVGELAVDGAALRYIITGHSTDSPVYVDNTGTLTELGQEALRSIVAGLADETLEETYGCPDCADGGASHVTLARKGAASTHTYEFYRPPAVLAELDALLGELIGALENCAANDYVALGAGCAPRPQD